MGPRAWSFWVEMPISQPRPNSPPSVKRVDTFTYTAALSTPAVNTAWAAACAELNQDPTKLSGNVSLTRADGARRIGTVSASLDGTVLTLGGQTSAVLR